MRPPLLIIGHSDASGRHGLAADLRAAESLGVETMPVITSFTVGDPESPTALAPVAARTIQRQLSAALDKEPAAALIGTIARPRHARLIAKEIASRGPAAVVLAPVPDTFDIQPLVSGRWAAAVRRFLVPEARAVVLPAESASAFLGVTTATADGDTIDELRAAGEKILALGAATAWMRAAENESRRVDVLVDADGSGLLDYMPPAEDAEPHTAPACLAALLALGTKMRPAVERAHRHAYSLDRTLHPV